MHLTLRKINTTGAKNISLLGCVNVKNKLYWRCFQKLGLETTFGPLTWFRSRCKIMAKLPSSWRDVSKHGFWISKNSRPFIIEHLSEPLKRSVCLAYRNLWVECIQWTMDKRTNELVSVVNSLKERKFTSLCSCKSQVRFRTFFFLKR